MSIAKKVRKNRMANNKMKSGKKAIKNILKYELNKANKELEKPVNKNIKEEV